jgi:hypothetical protein
MLVWFTGLPTGNGFLAGYFAGASGWGFQHNGAAVEFFTNATVFRSPARTVMAGDLNAPILITGQWDGAAVRFYWNGVEVGSGTAAGSYTVPQGGEALALGRRYSAASPTVNTVIAGIVGGNQALSAGNVTTLQAQYTSTRRTPLGTGFGPTNRYDVSSNVTGASFPNGLTDRVATDNMTFTAGASSGITLATYTY